MFASGTGWKGHSATYNQRHSGKRYPGYSSGGINGQTVTNQNKTDLI